jgi:outer membrane receptor protein involved in Fe transport
MELLPTFTLRFDPQISTTSYYSVGALLKYRHDFAPARTRLITGLDLDYSPGWREEDRIWTTTEAPGSPVFVSYTNQGRMYDYDVTFWQASPYVQLETSPVERLRLSAGLRFDVLGFDYENHLTDGAFAADIGPNQGQQRTFFRPPDQDLDYDRLSPSAGATWAFTPHLNAFVSYKQSFRVPQEGNLFRQGSNRDSTSLAPVKAQSYEVGMRGSPAATFTWEVSAYSMDKDDDILTFNDGTGPTQTNNGKTRHQGIELALGWAFLQEWRLDVAASQADHEYREWVTSTAPPAVDFSDNTMASAPEHVANATLGWSPRSLQGFGVEAEWTYLGSYWMDDANTTKYDGHELVNLRAHYETHGGTDLFVRATNVLDSRWATATQVSAGQPQYAPGLPFTLYAGVSHRFH